MTELLEKCETQKTAHRENTPDTQKSALWNFSTSDFTYSTTIFDDKTQCSRLENQTYTYDTASGVRYYGYRYYTPELGRWISRDPVGEVGGKNLLNILGNDCINFNDPHGLIQYDDRTDVNGGCCYAQDLKNIIEEDDELRGIVDGLEGRTRQSDGKACLGSIRCSSPENCPGAHCAECAA